MSNRTTNKPTPIFWYTNTRGTFGFYPNELTASVQKTGFYHLFLFCGSPKLLANNISQYRFTDKLRSIKLLKPAFCIKTFEQFFIEPDQNFAIYTFCSHSIYPLKLHDECQAFWILS